MKFARFINDEGSVSTVNADDIDPKSIKGICIARMNYVRQGYFMLKDRIPSLIVILQLMRRVCIERGAWMR